MNWQQAWDGYGVTLRRGDDVRRLSHTELAALNDYEAAMLGLPRSMEAVMLVSVEGRIERPGFIVRHVLEPFTSVHPWTIYRRDQSRIFVGERQWRLNRYQLALWDAMDAMRNAGDDIAARLRAWPTLEAALHAPRHSRILVQGFVPYLQVSTAPALPADSMVRDSNGLRPAEVIDPWSMHPRRRYFVRQNI